MKFGGAGGLYGRLFWVRAEEDGFGERRILGDRRAYGESIVFNSDLRAGQGVKVVMGQGSSGQW